jgi:hypothetical protein
MAQQFLYDRNTGQVRLPDGSRLPPGTEANISELLRQQGEVTAGTGLASLQRELARKTAQSETAMSFDEGATGTMLAEEAGRLRKALPGAETAFSEAQNRAVVSPGIDRGLTDLEGPEAVVSQMSPEELDIFNNLDRAADRAAPDVLASGAPVLGPSGMEMEARGRMPRAAGSASDATQPAAPAVRSTMEADARDRGPMIMNPADVAAGLNAPDLEVREKTVQDFMQEYAAAAPKYEGMDKNLMLAQIGFAIAAGESPNAMQNIANGLLAGSDMMLKDKAAKDEFDRQVQLNAMQYGFGEAARDRELERQATNYVAGQDVTYKGRKYSKGSTVPVLNSDVIKGRLPDGLLDTALAASLVDKNTAMQDAMVEAYEQRIVDDTTLAKDSETYASLVDEAVRIQRSNDLFEKALFVVADDGTVTGGQGALKNFVYKAANLAGVNPENLDDLIGQPAELEKLLVSGATAALPAYLGNEAGNAISNQDVERNMRVIVRGVTAAGSFDALFKNDRTVMADIQVALRENMGQMSRIFGQMNSIESRYANRYSASGSISSPVSALSVLEPIKQSAGLSASPIPTENDIVVGEDGVWNLYSPGS